MGSGRWERGAARAIALRKWRFSAMKLWGRRGEGPNNSRFSGWGWGRHDASMHHWDTRQRAQQGSSKPLLKKWDLLVVLNVMTQHSSAWVWGGGVRSVCLTSWCTAACRHLSAAVTCSAWSCCAQWISSHWGRRCRESRCYWPAGCSRGASPSGPWSTDARLSSFGGRTRQWCIPARAAAESVNALEATVTKRQKWKRPLTISVSETGPKLVTKMLVLISVTFSVDRKQICG